MNFSVGLTASLTMQRTSPLTEMYTLSPFVWRESDQYRLLVRAVPHSENPAEKIARIYYGESVNGIHFKMRKEPAIAPGPGDEDIDGCEDPTLAIVSATYYVYYTGWNEAAKRGRLLLASGPAPNQLAKKGVALPWTPQRENPKEATIVGCPDGTWRLFFEYAAGGSSKIGLAAAPHVDGPWSVCEPLFHARADHWDSWHLSTGPVLALPSDPDHRVMFYQWRDSRRQMANRLDRLRSVFHRRRGAVRRALDRSSTRRTCRRHGHRLCLFRSGSRWGDRAVLFDRRQRHAPCYCACREGVSRAR